MPRSRALRLLAAAAVLLIAVTAAGCQHRSPRDTAVSTIRAQIGVPYKYGGASPSGFDCSGLTSWTWARAGVRLPRTAAAQYKHTQRISRSQLKHGDLVFWGSGGRVTHVAMYIGGGRIVHARKPGTRVEYQNVSWWPSARIGYGRVAAPNPPPPPATTKPPPTTTRPKPAPTTTTTTRPRPAPTTVPVVPAPG